RTLQALGRHQEAAERLERARTIVIGSGDRGGLVRVLAALAAGALAVGATQRAEPYLNEARAVASSPTDRAVVQNEGANLRAAESDPAEALAAYREAADLAERGGQRALAAHALTNAALVAGRGGQPREAKPLLGQARHAWRRLPPSHDVAFGLISVALGYR